MPKVDASAFSRPPRKLFERNVSDPASPEKVVEIKGRKLGKLELSSALAYANTIYADHMTGYGNPEDKGYVAPQILMVDEDPVLFDLSAAQAACVLFRCQTVPDVDRYTPQEILRLMAVDALMEGLQEAAQQAIPEEEETPDPLAPSGSAAPSSPTPATETSTATPSSSNDATSSTGASTSDSELSATG